MMDKSQWMSSSVKTGDSLLVIKPTRLWPLEMWYEVADDVTMRLAIPILEVDDACGVIDTLTVVDDAEHVYAALVVSPKGVGCVFTIVDHFEAL